MHETAPRAPEGRGTTAPLLERETELAALDHGMIQCQNGRGGVVFVEAGPGLGKSRLLAEARATARAAGFRVLGAYGDDMERDYAYGVVRQLFEPVVRTADGAAWMTARAEAARPVFAAATAVPASPYPTLDGLHWLTVAASAERPLALVVDDLHCVDGPSLAFLEFLARRVEDLPVLLVLASRPAQGRFRRERAISADPATVRLAPQLLSEPAIRGLTERLLGVASTPAFAAACHHATGGNPLLMVELLRGFRAEGIVPDDASVFAVEHLGPPAVARSVLLRLRRLGSDALTVAQALAVLGPGAAGWLLQALTGLDERAVTRAIDALARAEIVDRHPLKHTHPIIRDAIYRELSPPERAQRHALAAQLLMNAGAATAQVGAHLLQTSSQGRTWVIDQLRAAAADATNRGATEIAVTFLRRALGERPGDASPQLLLQLGTAEAGVDVRAAAEHLGQARDATLDPVRRREIAELMAQALVLAAPIEALTIARSQPQDGPGLLAAIAHYLVVSDVPLPPGPGGSSRLAVQAWERALAGEDAPSCVAQALAVLSLEPGAELPLLAATAATTALVLAADERALGLSERIVRCAGTPAAVAAADTWSGWALKDLGDLPAAETALRRALTGPAPAHAAALLAWVLTERGKLDGARRVLDAHQVQEGEAALLHRCAAVQLSVRERGFQDAIDRSDDPRLRRIANPAWAPWRSLRAEALAAVGQLGEAIALADEELELARRWGTPGPIARALVVVGTLRRREDLVEEAVAVTRDTPAQLEHARALIGFGEMLRRDGRPADARASLREGQALASRCGAQPLAARAAAELAAAGGRPRVRAESGVAGLTPSERRVAVLAAAGRRNRDIAAELFLSPKTVEVHLSSAYRKLGIRTRAELPADGLRLAGAGVSPWRRMTATMSCGSGGPAAEAITSASSSK